MSHLMERKGCYLGTLFSKKTLSHHIGNSTINLRWLSDHLRFSLRILIPISGSLFSE